MKYILKNTINIILTILGCMVFLVPSLNAQFCYKDILAGKDKVVIPFEYVEGFIVMDVALNNALPLSFIFDTGAENTVLLEKFYAKLMGLKMDEEIKVIGADKSVLNTAYISRRVPLSFMLGGSFITDILVLEKHSIDFNNIIGRSIDGILGGNILLGAVVEIDYRRQVVIFHDSETYEKPTNFYKEKIQVSDQRPYITSRVSIEGKPSVDLKMLMDTGAGLHFLLEEDSHPTIMMPDSVLDGRIGSGLGGNLGGFLGNVAEFDLLNDEFRNIPVYFHRKDTSYLALLLDKQRNGIIGNIYWQNFKLVLDYSSQTLYMKPYRRKLKKFRFNKSGLVIFAVGRDFEEFIIKHVTPGSPADEAGLQSGDIVKSFNKIPISYLSLGQVNKRLSGNEGDKIKIKILRKGEKIKYEFRLKSRKIKVR